MNTNLSFRRVLFGGYYGMDNVGDDSFGLIASWGAKNYWQAEHAVLLSQKGLNGIIATDSGLRINKTFKGQTVIESTYQMLKATLIVWAGGSIFHSKEPYYSPRNVSCLLSEAGITPAGAIGVSLGPYKTIADKSAVYKSLHKLKFMTLRDKASYDEALSLNLPFTPVLAADLAMLLPKLIPDYLPKSRTNKILGISVCHYERYLGKDQSNELRREKVLLESLIHLAQSGFSGIYRFFVFNANEAYGDEEITHKFCNILKKLGVKTEIVPYSTDPVSIWLKIAETTAMISTRLHGAIFAAAANVPCMLIEYHRKCTDFTSDIGIDNKWRIGDADCSNKHLADKAIELLDYPGPDYYVNRDRQILLAEQNFTSVKIVNQVNEHFNI